jgi:hypothetical protein
MFSQLRATLIFIHFSSFSETIHFLSHTRFASSVTVFSVIPCIICFEISILPPSLLILPSPKFLVSYSLSDKMIMMLHEIMVTQCTGRSQQALVSGSTNSVVRWIWQQHSLLLTVVSLMIFLCRRASWKMRSVFPRLDIIIALRVREPERLVFMYSILTIFLTSVPNFPATLSLVPTWTNTTISFSTRVRTTCKVWTHVRLVSPSLHITTRKLLDRFLWNLV